MSEIKDLLYYYYKITKQYYLKIITFLNVPILFNASIVSVVTV